MLRLSNKQGDLARSEKPRTDILEARMFPRQNHERVDELKIFRCKRWVGVGILHSQISHFFFVMSILVNGLVNM